MYFLNNFLIKISSMYYLAKSPEMQAFIRPQGKSEDSLKSLSKTNTDMIIKYYRENIHLYNPEAPDSTVSKYNNDINEFVKEQKALMTHLKNFTKFSQAIVPMKEQELKYYRSFADFLSHYEEGQEKAKVNFGASFEAKLVSGDNKAHLKNQVEHLSKELQNPFKHIRNWVKGEMLNLGALIQAITDKEACESKKA